MLLNHVSDGLKRAVSSISVQKAQNNADHEITVTGFVGFKGSWADPHKGDKEHKKLLC